MGSRKVDRRIQRTRQLMDDALIELILEKGYDKITVQNIVDQANVGRSTFYAHYLDKDDLMEKSVEMMMEEFGPHFSGSNDGDAQDVMIPSLAFFQHTQTHPQLYKAMLSGRAIEIVVKAIRDGLIAHARAYFEQEERAGKRLGVPMEILTTHLAGSLLTLLTWWLDNEMPYPPEQMDEMFQQLTMLGIGRLITNGSGVAPD